MIACGPQLDSPGSVQIVRSRPSLLGGNSPQPSSSSSAHHATWLHHQPLQSSKKKRRLNKSTGRRSTPLCRRRDTRHWGFCVFKSITSKLIQGIGALPAFLEKKLPKLHKDVLTSSTSRGAVLSRRAQLWSLTYTKSFPGGLSTVSLHTFL